jgi:hypothetical protein
VTGDREEPNRVLGFPVSAKPLSRQPGGQRRTRDAEPGSPRSGRARAPRPQRYGEQQRVLGFPVDWFEEFGREVLRPLADRIWRRRDRG